ncbi:MAG: hypothetical protein K2O18_16130 [Oscillospiraceae bacterium]|nr:hypothetical protein [Oscillospiraceae bacterium]
MSQRSKSPSGKGRPLCRLLITLVTVEALSLPAAAAAGTVNAAAVPEPQAITAPLSDTVFLEDILAAEALPPAEQQKPEGELTGPEILEKYRYIAHGLGTVGGVSTLNCRECFEEMYRKGVRVFEADFRLTRDAKLVLRHDWRATWQEGVDEATVPTLEEFRAKPVLGKYTPMSFQDLLLLMREYPDVCIITDTKFVEPEFVQMQFDEMLSEAKELGLSYLLDRFVVQFYNRNMYTIVENTHHFPGCIYTLYQEKFDGSLDEFRVFAEFCSVHDNILGITIDKTIWRASYANIADAYGLKLYSHTVNDPQQAEKLFGEGIDAVYTDLLSPVSEPAATAE